MKIRTFLTLAAAAVASLATAPADDLLRATKLELLDGGIARLTFEDLGTAAAGAGDYKVDASDDLKAWDTLDEVIISDLGGGKFRATILDDALDARFYRVRFGQINSGPTVLAWFDLAELAAQEGDGTLMVTVRFSGNYTGPVRYSWSGGAAVGGLSGVVNAGGTSVQIPLSIGDDGEVGELGELTLTLITGQDTNYAVANAPGQAGSTTLVIEENDALWTGRFAADSEAVGFGIQIAQNGAAHTAKIIGGGSGLVPAGATGDYAASQVTHTASDFHAVIPNIGVAASEANLLGADAVLTFTFDATGVGVGDFLIEGTATCTIARPGAPHLDRTLTGTFVLARSPTSASSTEVKLN
ncbi:MAG: hypothetical protein R3F11_09630 [Verrucomicrobiales bacterium]